VGNINGSDRIVAEPLSPPDTPQVIMIRWPQPSTVVAPTRFPSTASEIARVRMGEYRVDSDQGTPTLTPTSSGIERSDLDRSSVRLPDQSERF
jgi:hypothetical protein